MKYLSGFFSFLTMPPIWHLPLSRKARPRLLLGIALLSGIFSLLLDWQRLPVLNIDEIQVAAARTATQASQVIKSKRLKLGIPVNPALDPLLSGLVGVDITDLTSTIGTLRAKQTSLNPDFASLVVFLLRQARVVKGDVIAINFSGSFPALNIAVLSACLHLELKPRIISSIGASSYGANIPGLTWADMETTLFKSDVFPYRSMAMSLGGIVDTEGGIDGTGIDLGLAAIRNAGIPYLPEGEPKQLEHDILRRKEMYFYGSKPSAFINVGGAITSLGWVAEAALLDNGLLKFFPSTSSSQRGLLFRMHEENVPVIHLLNIERLAAKYGLPQRPVTLLKPGTSLGYYLKRNLLNLGVLIVGWALLSLLALIQQAKDSRMHVNNNDK